jgi:hypothetical protein
VYRKKYIKLKVGGGGDDSMSVGENEQRRVETKEGGRKEGREDRNDGEKRDRYNKNDRSSEYEERKKENMPLTEVT